MLDLKFGDICICDLSYSINTAKTSHVPLMFLSADADVGRIMYRFCRIGKAPAQKQLHPFVILPPMHNLKPGSTVYPTKVVLFPSGDGIKRKISHLADEECRSRIELIIKERQKELKQALIMTLCRTCLKNFMMDTTSVIRRLDPYSLQQDECDYCQVKPGHTYLIMKKKQYGGYKTT